MLILSGPIEDQREVGTKIRTLDAPNRPLRHSAIQFYEPHAWRTTDKNEIQNRTDEPRRGRKTSTRLNTTSQKLEWDKD